MRKITIVHLEDEIAQRESFSRSAILVQGEIDQRNLSIDLISIASWLELTELENNSRKIDGLILDMKLSESGGNHEGVEILKGILGRKLYPVFVYSGSAKYPLDQFEEFYGPYFKWVVKGGDEGPPEILRDLVAVFESALDGIKGIQDEIERVLIDQFWVNFSHAAQFGHHHETASQFNRRILTQLLHKFEQLAGNDKFDQLAPNEMYLHPKSGPIFTGDIFTFQYTNESEGSETVYGVLVTPACDIFKDSLDLYTFCRLIPFSKNSEKGATIENSQKVIIRNSGPKPSSFSIKELVTARIGRYHFCTPTTWGFPGGIIDFMNTWAIPKENCERKQIIASFSPRFSRDIIGRFSQFYGRQGAPEFDASLLNNILIGMGS